MNTIEQLQEIAFRTDPRVIEYAKRKGEVNTEDQSSLESAVSKVLEIAKRGNQSPEVIWWEEAGALAKRIGQRWAPPPPAVDLTMNGPYKDAGKHVAERIAQEARYFDEIRDVVKPVHSPQRVMETMVAFPPTEIPCMSSIKISTQAYIPFRPRRLIIDENFCRALLVKSIQIGKNHQLANVEPLPGSLFAPSAFPLTLQFDTIRLGQLATLEIQNVTGANVMFSGAFLGLGLV